MLDLDEDVVIEKVVIIAIASTGGDPDGPSTRHIYTGASRNVDWMDQYTMLKLAGKFVLDDE